MLARLAVTRQVATTTAGDTYPVITGPKLSLTSSMKQCNTKPNTTEELSGMLPRQPCKTSQFYYSLYDHRGTKLALFNCTINSLEMQPVCISSKDFPMVSRPAHVRMKTSRQNNSLNSLPCLNTTEKETTCCLFLQKYITKVPELMNSATFTLVKMTCKRWCLKRLANTDARAGLLINLF